MNHPATAYIDLKALHHNLHKIKERVPKSNILAMVKRDAYGHGAIDVARSIESEVNAFGVAFLKEAIQLQDSGIKKPIVILTGFFDAEELSVIDKLGFECVIHNFEQIKILEQAKLSRPLRVWLKIDTGMHRLGFGPDQVQDAYKALMQNKMVQKPLRLVTHFSDADNKSDKTLAQIECFKKATADLEGELCMANSPAILSESESNSLWARPGVSLYGVSPFADKTGLDLDLKPVMTLASRIIAIHDLEKGEAVGYGSSYICSEKMRVGIVSIGYGDGYPRNARTGTPVLVDGVRTQLIGCVAMDMIAVDLRPVLNAKVGSTVVLWGKGLPVEEIAASSGESQYELIGRLTSRLHYVFD